MRKRQQLLPRMAELAVFVLLEVLSLRLVFHSGPQQQSWLTRGAQRFMGTVWGATERVSDYFSLSETNRELAQENHALQEQLALAQEQLRSARIDTLGTDSRPGFSMVHAEVVKLSRNTQHNYLILNRGYADGIQEKSGIITPQGVVGIVDAVSEHHAFGLSFQNSDFSISARLGGEGATGLLVWDGIHSHGALLKEIPLQTRYHAGDTVFTSGHSLMFPPDIPLGRAGASRVVNGSTQEIDVTLFQDFSAVRYVTVVHNNSFDEIEGFQP